MNKQLFQKLFIVSFFGILFTILIGIVGYDSIWAALPFVEKSKSKPDDELMLLEKKFMSGDISKAEYDSLTDIYKQKMEKIFFASSDAPISEEMPDWLKKLGFQPPANMVFEPIFSSYTSSSNPKEGFNSAELVYKGVYDTALLRSQQIAEMFNLEKHSLLPDNSKRQADVKVLHPLVYLNYQLSKPSSDYLISAQVLPSGRLSVIFTNNKQLNAKLLAYQPLNNRVNSTVNRKK